MFAHCATFDSNSQVAEVFCRCTPNLCQGVHRLSATRWNISILKDSLHLVFVFVTILVLVHISTLVLVFTLILLFALLLHILFVLFTLLFHLTLFLVLVPIVWAILEEDDDLLLLRHNLQCSMKPREPDSSLTLPFYCQFIPFFSYTERYIYHLHASQFRAQLQLKTFQVTSGWGGRRPLPPSRVTVSTNFIRSCTPILTGILRSSALTDPEQWSISVPAPKHTHTNTKHAYSSIMKLNRSENMDLRLFIGSARGSLRNHAPL